MAINLNRLLTNNETSYIQKHNENYTAIESALNSLFSMLSGAAGSGVSMSTAYEVLFGPATALIGKTSFNTSTSGTLLTFSSGYAWNFPAKAVIAKNTSQSLNFTGQPANTYHIHFNSSGVASFDTDPAESYYSVVWTGSEFGTITRLVNIAWAFQEFLGAQTSAALAATYLSLDERLEAGETKAVAGDKAGTQMNTKTTKSVAGGVNVTLTATEAKAAFFEFTGVLTANIDVVLPLSNTPVLFSVKNSTTGDFTLNVRGSGGTGYKVPQGYKTVLTHNGTNVESAIDEAYIVAKEVTYSANITLDWSQYDCAYITLTGNATITHTNARKGQKCLLYLAQDATGGRTVTWGAEVGYGSDISGITLTSTPSKTDEIAFSYNWKSSKYNVVSIAHGY